ncbi:hypothetical protein [Intrasporangium calvum]|uniref:hypothetical protein n=1 Tax=Intrasporangium calvum TaxID=53358 RepID=UPI000DF5F671|nr:hypothetical protein [Intrasporangium calvum]AXG12979.1 hypothetical protein DN585_05740 [Intrasporangium calvum]
MNPGVDLIDFGDAHGVTDLATFVGRARVAVPDGAVRLQVPAPGLLVATVAILEGTGLMGEGTVLGLRVVSIREAAAGVDATVSFRSVSDRLARHREEETTFSVPATTVTPSWAGLTPPRQGWERVGLLDGAAVRRIAEQGIAEVAEQPHQGGGGAAVAALRRRVWGAMSDTVPPIAAGLAFGAHVLGFLRPGETAAVATCGRWTRLSTVRGHVLMR